MRQAIDEGFILDVLRNYLTYQTYWRLRNAAVEEASRQVDPAQGQGEAGPRRGAAPDIPGAAGADHRGSFPRARDAPPGRAREGDGGDALPGARGKALPGDPRLHRQARVHGLRRSRSVLRHADA